MNTTTIKYYLNNNGLLVLIILLAVFLRFYHIDYQSLWVDEIYTLNITNPALSYKELVESVEYSEGFPYLYYFLLRGFYSVFGYSGMAARLPSAIAGVVAVYTIYVLVKKMYSKNAGLAAALLLTINEFHINYSQEARSYSIYVLALLFCFYRFSVFIKNPSFKNVLWYSLSAGLLLNFSFFGAINLLSQYIILLVALIYTAKADKAKLFKYGLLSGIIALIMFAPNYKILIKMFEVKSFWIGRPQPDSFRTMFSHFLGEFEISLAIFAGIIVYYFNMLFKKLPESFNIEVLKNNQDVHSFLTLISWFALFMFIMIYKSYVGLSVILDRYFISMLPVLVIVMGIGISQIKNVAVRAAIISTIILFTGLNIITIKKYYNSKHKSQFREVSQFIEINNTDDAPVYSSLKILYDFYLDNDKVKTNLYDGKLDEVINAMVADSTKRKSFWYADAHVRPFAVTDANKEYLKNYFKLDDNFERFDAWTRHYVLKTGTYEQLNQAKLPALIKAGEAIKYNFDEFVQNDTEIRVTGWAFLAGQDAENVHINLVLILDGKAILLDTEMHLREDVNSAMGNGYNLDNSGFKNTEVPKNVPPGQYKVGIYIIDKVSGKEALTITDKTFGVK